MDDIIAKKYRRLDPIEHVLHRPSMYIGGVEPITEDIWILQGDKIVQKNITYIPGLYKIFDEAITNVYDQTIRDLTLTRIDVDIDPDNNLISVYNDGIGIDVTMHPSEHIYVPELIFGHLRTSTSFDEDETRLSAGLFGLGIKLTAIFSTYFHIEIGDLKRHKLYNQTFTNNLSNKSKPVIKDYKGKTGFVKVSFKPDLKYFKIDSVSPDFVNLLKRRVYDLTGLVRKNISIYLNGVKLDISGFSEYVSLYALNDNQLTQVYEDCNKSDPTYKEHRY
jgi:DNA topoisomerase-2